MADRFRVTLDGNRGQTRRPLNELNLTAGRVAWSATIHLERAKLFAALRKDPDRKENMQAK
ncbi:MAG: hypothetical protein WBG02_00600 [Candidatus Acidiferrum sp.]